MRNPLIKDTFREIKKTKGRFFSIFGIVMIGVAFFSGILATAPDMKYTADQYYDDYNLMDYHVLSNFGITEDDVRQLRKVEGVEGVSAGYTRDVITQVNSTEQVLKVHSLDLDHLDPSDPDYINQLIVTEGRLPEKSGECVIEDGKIKVSGLKIGDVIKIESGTSESLEDTFVTDTYKIVGTVQTPYYLSYEKGTSNIGSGRVDTFLFVPSTDFKMEVYTDVYLTATNAKALNSYKDEYFDFLEPVSEKLNTLGNERAELRRESIVDEAMKEYNDGKAEYEAGVAEFNKQIADAEKLIEENKDKLLVGEATLTSSKVMAEAQLKQGEAQIDMIKKQIDSLNQAYRKKKAEFEKANAPLVEQRKKLEEEIPLKEKELEEKKIELEPQIQKRDELVQIQVDLTARQLELETRKALSKTDPETYPPLTEEEAQELEEIPGQLIILADEIAQVQEELNILITMEAELTQARLQLDVLNESFKVSDEVLAEIDKQIATANGQIEQQRQEIVQAKSAADKKIAEEEAKLNSGRKQLAQAEVDLAVNKAQAESDLEDAREQLVLAENRIEQIEQGKWYVLDRHYHYSYMDYKGAADRMASIAKVFPVFFFLVAGLVCLTTMTRMVDEHRNGE